MDKDRILSIADALHGTSPGRIQSVGYMQVIPLVSDLVDDRFVSPVEGEARVSTSGYGTLCFENPGPAVLIVPCHTAYVVKQAAQDHAMSHAGIVRGSRTRAFDTAMCVQQTQGGLIRKGSYQLMLLPFVLREPAIRVRKQQNHGKLWEAIRSFNAKMGVEGPSHLHFFLQQFQKELDEFVAEFECVPNQVGAVILVDDHVVGVERAPSHDYWRSVWPCLIRECYGSLAIQVARSKAEALPPPSRAAFPEELGSLEDLGRAVEELAAEEERRARDIVRDVIAESIALETDEKIESENLTLETLRAGRFVGQVVSDGERIVYASILASKRWLANQKWKAAARFSI